MMITEPLEIMSEPKKAPYNGDFAFAIVVNEFVFVTVRHALPEFVSLSTLYLN